MSNINIVNSIVNFIDYTPLSPIKNSILLLSSCVSTTHSDVPTTQPTPQHSFTAIHERSTIERVILLVPFLGCIVIALYDLSVFLSQSKQNSQQDLTNPSEIIPVKINQTDTNNDHKFLENIPQELIEAMGADYFKKIPEIDPNNWPIVRDMTAPVMRHTFGDDTTVLIFAVMQTAHKDLDNENITYCERKFMSVVFKNKKIHELSCALENPLLFNFHHQDLTPFVVDRLKRLMKFEPVGPLINTELNTDISIRPQNAYLSKEKYQEFIRIAKETNTKTPVYEQKVEKDSTEFYLYDPTKALELECKKLENLFPNTPYLSSLKQFINKDNKQDESDA